MRILVNATTCVVGGGVQVAAAFIGRSLRDPGGDSFTYVVSPAVQSSLGNQVPLTDQLQVVQPSPARLWAGRPNAKRLQQIEAEFRPDVVFTVFGPAYVRFTATHLCGIADPWVTHPSPLAANVLSTTGRLRVRLKTRYKAWRLSPKDFYWVESSVSQHGLSRILGIPLERIRVIPNCYAPVFDNADYGMRGPHSQTMRILTLSAPYPHKNLIIIPRVAALLQQRDPQWSYRFKVTLPEEGPEVENFWVLAQHLGVMDMIDNVGPVHLYQCPALYAESDIMFLPTLLETFSVSYLEAMRANCAIVTTDLDFARDVCGEAAEYFDPSSPEAAAMALERIAHDARRRLEVTGLGRKRLMTFPTPEEKYQAHLDWLREVAV
ncbi:MAG: glycosyltransferase [Desulfarculaceae bacterium]|nr:glycosyltransferase [Desulfarculaceae bacterium]MCF8118283.1 glycosyltransferase [Desulfarculaceae bacterium]